MGESFIIPYHFVLSVLPLLFLQESIHVQCSVEAGLRHISGEAGCARGEG